MKSSECHSKRIHHYLQIWMPCCFIQNVQITKQESTGGASRLSQMPRAHMDMDGKLKTTDSLSYGILFPQPRIRFLRLSHAPQTAKMHKITMRWSQELPMIRKRTRKMRMTKLEQVISQTPHDHILHAWHEHMHQFLMFWHLGRNKPACACLCFK